MKRALSSTDWPCILVLRLVMVVGLASSGFRYCDAKRIIATTTTAAAAAFQQSRTFFVGTAGRQREDCLSGNRRATTTPFTADPTTRIRASQRLSSSLLRSSSSSSEHPHPNGHAETTNDNDNHNNVDDYLSEFRNKNNLHDQVFSALSQQGGIKVTAATARNLLNDLMMAHNLSAVSAEALGRTVVCSLLMANGIQDDQVVQITIQSPDGPIRGIVAICSGRGEVRGYVGSPMLGAMSLEDAVGRRGSVQVVKNHPSWPRPYNGITAIRHGDIDRDVGIYLAESEQRTCALAAATAVNGILCTAAGGYLVELLPGVTEEEKERVEQNLAKLVALDGGEKLPTNLLLSGYTPVEMAEILLEGLDLQPLQQLRPQLRCECTRDRLVRSLRLLPREEVEDLLRKQERVEARCEFCGKEYRMEADEVRDQLANAASRGSSTDDD